MSMDSTPPLAVEARGLTKRYAGDVLAVDGLDLRVEAGIIYALLGPNGAGKTTTISMLTTLIPPTAGAASVAGCDITRQPGEVRKRIGVTFQEIVLDQDLTAREVLDFHGRLYSLTSAERAAQIDRLLKLVELEDAADRLVKHYSGGMKRRLELARGLMTNPAILFLDEPTQGLDPQNRARVWDYLRMLRQEKGLTILLTTHYMEEAEALADRVGIIDHGHLIVEGTPQGLAAELSGDVIRIVGAGRTVEFAQHLRSAGYVRDVHAEEDSLQVGVDDGSRRLVEVVQLAMQNGFQIEDVSVSRPGLGDVFLKHTGHALRDQ